MTLNPDGVKAATADVKLEAVYRASRNLANNIAEFGEVTDGEFIDALDTALDTLIPERLAVSGGEAVPVAWVFCPECGSEEILHEEGRHKQCANCGQEWFSDLNYLDVVAKNLRRLYPALPTVREEVRVPRKQFPILSSGGATVDWQLVADHGQQAQANHYQTVQRLAERGGLAWEELHAVLHDRRYQKIETGLAIDECRAIEARYLKAIREAIDA